MAFDLESRLGVNRSEHNYNLRMFLNNALSKKEKRHLFGKPISQLVVLPHNHNIPLDFNSTDESASRRLIGLVGDIIYAQKENALAVANWSLLQGLKEFYGVVDFHDSRLKMPSVHKGDLDFPYSRSVFKDLQKKQYQDEFLKASRILPASELLKRKKELHDTYLKLDNKGIKKKIEIVSKHLEIYPERARDTYGLFRRIFSDHFYDKKQLAEIERFYSDLKPSPKDKSNPYILPHSEGLVDSIRKIQHHFSEARVNGYRMPVSVATDLMNEPIDLTLYNLKQHTDSRGLFAIVKNKLPESTINKYLLTLIKRHLDEGDGLKEFLPEWMYTEILGCGKKPIININDHAGFSITTSDVLNINNADQYEHTFFNELKAFYRGMAQKGMMNVSHYKNHFRNALSKQAVEMYLSPTEKSLDEGLTLPFPEVAGDPNRFFDVLKASAHFFGAKEMAANHLGDPRIQAHYHYKRSEYKKNEQKKHKVKGDAQLVLAEHENFFSSVFDKEAHYARHGYTLDK